MYIYTSMFPQQRSSMTIHSDTSFNCAVTSIHRNSLFTNMNMNLSMEHLTCIHVLYIHDIVPCESRLTGFQTCFFRNAVILGTKIRHQSQKHLQDLVSMRWHSVNKLLRLKTQRSKLFSSYAESTKQGIDHGNISQTIQAGWDSNSQPPALLTHNIIYTLTSFGSRPSPFRAYFNYV